MSEFQPAYVRLLNSGILRGRAEEAHRRMRACNICPRRCGVNRFDPRQKGECRTGERAVVCSCHPHFGEEAPLVGHRGSGTIFFSWCNLHCRFCQNYDLSALGEGTPVTPSQIADMMLSLQAMGCHNINFVSPSHVVPQILAALVIAVERGLRVPLVYNTGGYDSLETLRLLDGIVDIYMPDMKYSDATVAEQFSAVKNYPQVNRAAVKEMHRQVGDMVLDERGIALRGLLVRHLVLPNGLAGTRDVVQFLAEEISKDTYLNLMDQYRPCYQADKHPGLSRRITRREYEEAVQAAHEVGLHRLDDRDTRPRLILVP